MSYRMHFFFTDHGDFYWNDLSESLKATDPQYDVVGDSPNVELRYGSGLYGRMELISPIDREWISELCDEIDRTYAHFREGRIEDEFDSQQIRLILNDAESALEINVVWQDRQAEDTLRRIDPIWEWLFNRRSGAIYDGSGWYSKEGRIAPIVRPKA